MSFVTEAVTFAYPDTLNKGLVPLKFVSIAVFEAAVVGEAGEEIETPVSDIVYLDAPSHFLPTEPSSTVIEYGMYSLSSYVGFSSDA